jgi:2-hydroxy-3-oxopropionate reductase
VSVAVIGLGRMGAPMAARLLDGGEDVVVFNRSPGPAEPLAAKGARVAADASEAAEADVVITMLSDPPVVEEIVLGPVLDAARPGSLAIDMSTSTPELAIRIAAAMAERGAGSVDAPVSGGVKGATEGTLSIMAGGAEADVERARPVLRHLGARITHIGGPGAGQIAKAANQLVVGLNLQAVAEALALARAAGVDPAKVREAMLGGFADSTILQQHAPRMLVRDFEPGGALKYHLKDVRIALSIAELPAARALEEQMQALIADGYGDCDHSVIARAYDDGEGA